MTDDGLTIDARLDRTWPQAVLGRGLSVIDGAFIVDVMSEADGEPDLVLAMTLNDIVEEYLDEWGDWSPLGTQFVTRLARVVRSDEGGRALLPLGDDHGPTSYPSTRPTVSPAPQASEGPGT